jgi:hypothetical protein
MSVLNEPSSPRQSLLATILLAVMTVLLAGATSAAVVLAILHFSPREDGNANPTKGDQEKAKDKPAPTGPRADGQPLLQQGEVKVEDAASASVFYPIPYASPPNLVLTTKSGGRKFVITRQDELGFTWSVALTAGEVKDLGDLLKPGDKKLTDEKAPEKKPDPGPHEFAWVAKGLPEKAGSPYPKPHEQKGSFTAAWGQEGEVYFSAPYATPPNVTLGVNTSNATIQIVSPLGFSWKNTGTSPLPAPSVPWTAVGVKATSEQLTLLAKSARPLKAPENPLKLVEQKGTFVVSKGEKGFPQPYAHPPNVETLSILYVIVTQVTPTGFKWEASKSQQYGNPGDRATWTAKGILATSLPVEKSGK